MNIDDFIKRNGPLIYAELAVSWGTRQTFKEYVENANDAPVSEAGFLKYVRNKVVDVVSATFENDGLDGLSEMVYLVDEYGAEVRAE